jgi:hypothetical protein
MFSFSGWIAISAILPEVRAGPIFLNFNPLKVSELIFWEKASWKDPVIDNSRNKFLSVLSMMKLILKLG